jgi:hypothetical protein
MGKPVVIDLCCGLGGWSHGFLAEGWDAIGFDIEKHEYGEKRYPGDLILKDITTLCGYDLRAVNPALVVASPPCQNYSYMAMPWSRAKEIAAEIRADESGAKLAELNRLYFACFRIARELDVPIVLENVKGAQPWVGRAQANYGSYYLWGDVANVGGRIVRASAPQFGSYVRAARRSQKFNPNGTEHGQGSWFAIADSKNRGAHQKDDGGSWFAVAHNTESGHSQNPVNGVKCPGNDTFKADGTPCGKLTDLRFKRNSDGVKIGGSGDEYWRKPLEAKRRASKSSSRKAASAMIAEIPFDLASYIARVFKPA